MHMLPQVIAELSAREAWMRQTRDRQGVFAAASIEVMRTMQADLERGAFGQPDWVVRCAVRFSQQYLAALDDAERGWWWRVPQAWALALGDRRRQAGSHMGSLLLSMNAHINHDLPLAIAETAPRQGGLARVAPDYQRILGTLWRSIPHIQARICRDYAPGLLRWEQRAAGLDDVATLAGVWAFRRAGWRWAERLAAASAQPPVLARLRAGLDRRACTYGRLLCQPGWAGRRGLDNGKVHFVS